MHSAMEVPDVVVPEHISKTEWGVDEELFNKQKTAKSARVCVYVRSIQSCYIRK